MNILVDIGHPADVHFFKNFLWEMQKKGHELFINTVSKDVTIDLLEEYNFRYELYGKRSATFLGHALEVAKRDFQIYKLQKKYNIDIIVGVADMFGAHVSKLTKAKSIIFTDTEHAKIINSLTFPFSDVVCTPSCFRKDLGKKQIRYDGYHELAYLHPNYFTPNPAVLDEIGLGKDDTFIIMRFVSWTASHDVGQHGIRDKTALVRELERYGQVFITSEGRLDAGLEEYKIKVAPEKMHDLLYYASLYVGEGATMASEAAVLGTHAVYVNTLRLGYTDEEEERYDLVYNFSDEKTMEKEAFDKALELLENNNLRKDGKRKREKLLKDKIDVTTFMVEFVENYPESFKEMLKED